MSEILRFVPPRVPFLDTRTGLISREWYLFLQGVFDRIGGSTGSGTNDLSAEMPEDAGIEEIKAELINMAQMFLSLPAQQYQDTVDQLTTELYALRARVDTLEKDVLAFQQLPT